MQTHSLADVVALISHPGEPRIFSLSEACELLPVIRKLTAFASRELDPCQLRMRQLLNCDPRLVELELEFETIIRKWVERVQRLGVTVSGLWQIGFDTGEGHLCWRYPELRLAYFRGYGENLGSRRRLSEVIQEYQPDWAVY
jgi:hypothetical protein